MREINLKTKYRVIELFLTGYILDEIAAKLDISKGSVVSIISDFREGKLELPRGMTAYVDELRHVVVDMRRNGLSLTQLKSYNNIHSKLQEMGASSEDAEGWLDPCRDIASLTTSSDQFASMISDLIRLSSETGLSLEELVKDYHEKLSTLGKLDQGIEQKNEGLNEIRAECEKGKSETKKKMEAFTRGNRNSPGKLREAKNGSPGSAR